MTDKTIARSRAEVGVLGDTHNQLEALDAMNVAQLAEKYRELYGEPTRSRNKDYLRKRLKWRLQAEREGGLSDSAVALIQKLGDHLPERWQMRQRPPETEQPQPAPSATQVATQSTAPRDPRVPPPGTILRRVFDGKTFEVMVCHEGFEFAGRKYLSLSKIATEIAGTRWNGYLFFGLKKRIAEGAAS